LIQKAAAQSRALVLALDHLQDPQNFGALCRSAEALGALGVLIPKDRGVGVTAGVYHASVGAVETIPIVQVTNLSAALRELKEAGFWIVGTSLNKDAMELSKIPSFEKIVLVLGAELEGMSASIEKSCDCVTYVPLIGKVQSLNVSAAGAILLHSLLTPRS
jgi:23S rRNA (guanosine2251-2'-O)-methyltransferase